MRRHKYLMALVFLGLLFVLVKSILAENLTLTTYYPAPHGAYDRIKLVPRDSLLKKEDCKRENDVGTLYNDNGKDKKTAGIYVCQKFDENTYDWVFLSRSFQPSDQIMNQKVVCIKPSGQFGVCMNNPSFDGTCACQ